MEQPELLAEDIIAFLSSIADNQQAQEVPEEKPQEESQEKPQDEQVSGV
jgi:hypothetical protein